MMMMLMMTSIIRHKVPAPAIAVLSLLREQEEDVLCSSKTMAPYCLCEPGCYSAPSASCCPSQPDRRGPCLERHAAVGLGVRHLRLVGPGLSGGDHTRRPHQKGNHALYTSHSQDNGQHRKFGSCAVCIFSLVPVRRSYLGDLIVHISKHKLLT